MNHTNDLEDLKGIKAEKREHKKRPRMRKHGQSLKKPSIRGIQYFHKVSKKHK